MGWSRCPDYGCGLGWIDICRAGIPQAIARRCEERSVVPRQISWAAPVFSCLRVRDGRQQLGYRKIRFRTGRMTGAVRRRVE